MCCEPVNRKGYLLKDFLEYLFICYFDSLKWKRSLNLLELLKESFLEVVYTKMKKKKKKGLLSSGFDV